MIPFDSRRLVDSFAIEIREASILGALAFSAIHGLKSDDISENDAFKKYGKAWIKRHVEKAQLHFARNGSTSKSTKVFSVFEIETLKRAEKRVEDMFNKAVEQYEQMKNNDGKE